MTDQSSELRQDKAGIRRPKKPGWRTVFLEELGKWGVVDHAIRAAGVNSSTAYRARMRDEHFSAQWDEAEGKLLATAEVIARQRALVGHPRPVYFQGTKVDTVQEIDNVHLRWLLSKLKPSVYGDKIEVTGKDGGAVQIEVTLPDNERGDILKLPSKNGHAKVRPEGGDP